MQHREDDRPPMRTNHRRIANRGLKEVLAAHLTMLHLAMHIFANSLNDQVHLIHMGWKIGCASEGLSKSRQEKYC